MSGDDRDRHCPICEGTRSERLRRQEFLLPGDIATHYDVVACSDCGFVFARELPSPEEYEAYYRTNLKYTFEASRDGAAARFAIHQGSFDLVDAHAGRESSILDVGCSTGELLALFARNGYERLAGVDPAPECAQIAKQLYGLDLTTAVISEFAPDAAYDVVLLANILEHIPNLRQAMDRLASFVKEGGLLFVQVPDGGHFGADLTEPFLEFSIEHINYFTETSLSNLLGALHIVRVEVRHDVVSYKGIRYPVITSVWRKESTRPAPPLEVSDADPVRSYIARSDARLTALSRTIDALVATGEPVVIWGVGSLTARFLATTNLGRANISGFVDSNSGHHGKRLLDREIAPPSSLAGKEVTVFVSSFVYGAEIRRTLEDEMRYRGRIVTI